MDTLTTTNGSANLVVPATPNITSSVLTPTAPIPYVTPNPTPVPSVDGLDASGNLTLTAPEQQESNLSTTIQGLNTQMIGKSADQTAEEAAAGVPTLTKQQQDLSTQISQLKNEALAIPQQLQLDATGRGVTAGGLEPLQTARLRTNSIAALGASSLLDATNGLLASAQSKADKAVAAKYDPIQEQIDAATKNLQLIQNDPKTTIADKNRAAAQLAIQTQKQAQLDTAKQNAKDVLSAAQTAAMNGADALTLQKMQKAPDGATALQIAATAGFGNGNVNDLITKYPDAGIVPGDSVQVAQQKILKSPSYTLDQKSKILDNQVKQSTIAKNNSDIAAQSGSGQVAVKNPDGSTTNIPASIAPYYNVSGSGTPYVDASTLVGTAAEKSQIMRAATAAGLTVVENKNEAADLTNIQNAYSNIDTIQSTLAGLTAPNALARATYATLGSGAASFLQTDAQKAAAGTLSDTGLDLLKAISGIQGFRGGTAVINQIKENLPTIYDTTATANQKLNIVRTLIQNREAAILGTSTSGSTPAVGQTVTTASGVPDGAIATGDDGKTYVAKGGQWTPQ